MPTSYTIDTAGQMVRVRAWGVYSDADLREYYRKIVADSRFRSSYRCLMNLEGVKVFALDCRVIAEVAGWAVFDVGTRRAIVAPSDVAYGLSRMFSMHGERAGQNIEVFRSEDAAEAWLASPVDGGREPQLSRAILGANMRVA